MIAKYRVKLNEDYAYTNYISTFYTNQICFNDNGIIEFEPIALNTYDRFPKRVIVHISNCIIFDMGDE